MSQTVVVNNENFTIPDNFDTGWGDSVTDWVITISASTLQLSGGNFTLTADVNFGPNFGLLAKYFETINANPAQSGQIRLAFSDTIDWRNSTNTDDLALGVDDNNLLTFNGVEFIDGDSSQTIENKDIILTPESITATTYTLQSTDAFSRYLQFSNTASQLCVIPEDDTDSIFDIGVEIPISQAGTGAVTVTHTGSVTINNPYNSLQLRTQYSSASLVKIGTNLWKVVGDFYNG